MAVPPAAALGLRRRELEPRTRSRRDLSGAFVGRFVDSDFASLQPPIARTPATRRGTRAPSVDARAAQLADAGRDRQPRERRLHGAARLPGARPRGARRRRAIGVLTQDLLRATARPRSGGGSRGAAARTAAPRCSRARATSTSWPMITMFDERGDAQPLARPAAGGARRAGRPARAATRHRRGCTWPTYNDAFSDALAAAARATASRTSIFGDILFEEHRRWAEAMCAPHGLAAVEPLFGASRRLRCSRSGSASGAEAIIVTARDECLDASWLGRPLRRDMLARVRAARRRPVRRAAASTTRSSPAVRSSRVRSRSTSASASNGPDAGRSTRLSPAPNGRASGAQEPRHTS